MNIGLVNWRLTKVAPADTVITSRTGSNTLVGQFLHEPEADTQFVFFSKEHPGGGVVTNFVCEIMGVPGGWDFQTASGSVYQLRKLDDET